MTRFEPRSRTGLILLGGLLGTTVLAASAVAQNAPAAPPAAPAQGVVTTTQDQLENPKAENWMLVNGNYAAHRFSPLKEITLDNIKGLKFAYSLSIAGVDGGGSRYANASLEGTPIVEDGAMYVTNGWGNLYKLDVRSGTRAAISWVMDPQVDKPWAGDVACCGIDNRGVALWKDKIISVALDGRMIATSKATGEIVWQSKLADPGVGETLTVAPLVVKDIGVLGPAGAEYGIRGHIMGVDLNTGKEVWRTWTVAGPDDPNANAGKTWGGKSYLNGGGSIWQTASYDPKTNLMYWGTGNPGPDYDSDYRPGDNLYTDSVMALAPETGKMAWYFQYTPNDPYDYDEIGVHPLVTATVGGQERQLVVHSGRNGFFYGMDRTNGQFIYGEQFVDLANWTNGIDPKTGKPMAYDPSKLVQDYVKGTAARRGNGVNTNCPVTSGGVNWEPAAYVADLQTLFIAGGEGCGQHLTTAETGPAEVGGTWKPRDRFVGQTVAPDPTAPLNPAWKLQQYGALSAIDVKNGKVIKKVPLQYFNRAGLLATAGGWLMMGEIDGTIHAYNAKTLDEVWKINVGAGIKAPPMSFSVNGKQYVAILVGALPATAEIKVTPELGKFTASHMLYVFSL